VAEPASSADKKLVKIKYMRKWRNWYTRTIEVRMEQSLEVQVLSCAQEDILYGSLQSGFFFGFLAGRAMD
jgi:hypothetical protein